MSTPTNTTSERSRAIYRCAAVLLLAFTAVDLASHGACGEDWLGLPPSSLRVAVTSDRGVAIPELRAAFDATDSTGERESAEEDCFCCCSHLLVTPRYVLPIDATELPSVATSSSRPLTAPPPSLDRPPRTV